MQYEFDFDAAKKAATDSIHRVDAAADRDVKALLLRATRQVAQRLQFFTADDVWELLSEQLPGWDTDGFEPRVMGAIMRTAAADGICAKTGDTRKSRMPACHGRDKRVWRSLLRSEECL